MNSFTWIFFLDALIEPLEKKKKDLYLTKTCKPAVRNNDI